MRKISILRYSKDDITGKLSTTERSYHAIYTNGLVKSYSAATDEYVKNNWMDICRPWRYYAIDNAF